MVQSLWIFIVLLSPCLVMTCNDEDLKKLGTVEIDKDQFKDKLENFGTFIVLYFPQSTKCTCTKGRYLPQSGEASMLAMYLGCRDGEKSPGSFAISSGPSKNQVKLQGLSMTIIAFDESLITFATCKTGVESQPVATFMAVSADKYSRQETKERVEKLTSSLKNVGVVEGNGLNTEDCGFTLQ